MLLLLLLEEVQIIIILLWNHLSHCEHLPSASNPGLKSKQQTRKKGVEQYLVSKPKNWHWWWSKTNCNAQFSRHLLGLRESEKRFHIQWKGLPRTLITCALLVVTWQIVIHDHCAVCIGLQRQEGFIVFSLKTNIYLSIQINQQKT